MRIGSIVTLAKAKRFKGKNLVAWCDEYQTNMTGEFVALILLSR